MPCERPYFKYTSCNFESTELAGEMSRSIQNAVQARTPHTVLMDWSGIFMVSARNS